MKRSFALLLVLSSSSVLAQPLVRVPADAPDLVSAVQRVFDGGVVEMAAGTYTAPSGGLLLRNIGKSLTVRAANGARVVLDGGGSSPVLRFENTAPDRGGPVTFEGIAFENGASSDTVTAGGVTVRLAEATFEGCEWNGNSAIREGGGLLVLESTVTVRDGVFLENRVNLPGHRANATGGAIYVLDGRLTVTGSRFEGNEAAFAGGAIYLFGHWGEDLGIPTAEVVVTSSTFVGNRLAPDPCCAPPGPTAGGAIHAEDHSRLRVHGSRFEDNEADNGGAIDLYRAHGEIHGSVFRGNRSLPANGASGIGGTLYVASTDFADASTDGGAINRRPGRLELGSSLLAGTDGAIAAHNGGCLTVSGDTNRMYGENGVDAEGTVEDNRAVALLSDVVFLDCEVAKVDGRGGLGGGIHASLADLQVDGSLVLGSEARGDGAAGGGIALLRETTARVVDTHFAGNVAASFGGGIYASGSHLEVEGSSFHHNTVRPGESPPVWDSGGAAILTAATLGSTPALPATGRVSDSLFAANVGLPIQELEIEAGPINAMVYDDNRFTDTTYGTVVFNSTLTDLAGSSVAGLNALVIHRPGGESTDKSTVANQRITVLPSEGRLLAVPPALPTQGAVGDPEPAALLAYTWTGPGSASLGGTPLGAPWGLGEADAIGSYPLTVGSAEADRVELEPGLCGTTSVGLCLNDRRFFVSADWAALGRRGVGRSVALTPDTGYFWFFRDTNVETVLKVLDGRNLNGHFWVFYGALSDVEYTLSVVDLERATLRSYRNPAGQFLSLSDTAAFPAAGTLQSLTAEEGFAAEGTCQGSGTRLCLGGDRFQVEVTWEDFSGGSGVGHAMPLTSDTGYFWFFRDSNVELILKVLDGRALNGHFWVFYGALSSVPYVVTVTDTETGAVWSYENPRDVVASGGDTEALPGAP